MPVKPVWLVATVRLREGRRLGLVVGGRRVGGDDVEVVEVGVAVAVVAVIRIVLAPAFSEAVRVEVAQVSQLPVPLKARPAETTVPLTETSAGRLTVVPLA